MAFPSSAFRRVGADSAQLYSVRRVWHQSNREELRVARRTVSRLMTDTGGGHRAGPSSPEPLPGDGRLAAAQLALDETIIGLYRTEVTRKRGPWGGDEEVELASPARPGGNHHRLLGPFGHVPDVEHEEEFLSSERSAPNTAGLKQIGLR